MGHRLAKHVPLPIYLRLQVGSQAESKTGRYLYGNASGVEGGLREYFTVGISVSSAAPTSKTPQCLLFLRGAQEEDRIAYLSHSEYDGLTKHFGGCSIPCTATSASWRRPRRRVSRRPAVRPTSSSKPPPPLSNHHPPTIPRWVKEKEEKKTNRRILTTSQTGSPRRSPRRC